MSTANGVKCKSQTAEKGKCNGLVGKDSADKCVTSNKTVNRYKQIQKNQSATNPELKCEFSPSTSKTPDICSDSVLSENKSVNVIDSSTMVSSCESTSIQTSTSSIKTLTLKKGEPNFLFVNPKNHLLASYYFDSFTKLCCVVIDTVFIMNLVFKDPIDCSESSLWDWIKLIIPTRPFQFDIGQNVN